MGDGRDPLTDKIIGSAIEVHRALGPGLLESAYEVCLCHELSALKIPFARQVPLPVKYKSIELECGYRMDVVVDDSVVLELKTTEKIMPVHRAQILTYLRLSGLKTGLLLNFNSSVLKHGIERFAL